MLKVTSPYDLSLIKEVPVMGEEQVEEALQRAHHLSADRGNWLPPYQRIAILEKAASIMESRTEHLTKTAAHEGGKPYQDSKVEVLRAINGVKLAASHIGQLKGEHIPMGMTKASEHRMGFTTREPIGVVFSVSAFNHPLNLIVHQMVTAVAAGCPVLVKPASSTPLSCLELAGILEEAGLPEGWCQPVVCDKKVAEKLVSDKRINFFSFIGSAEVGWKLRSKLAPGTRCALEHGGSAPVIVEKDADIEKMMPLLVKGGFYHAGQVCVSVQRVFVQQDIAKEVAEKMAQQARKLKVGNQLEEDTDVGPLIAPFEVDRVEEWVQEAVHGGAGLLCGGQRISDTCYQPTVLLNPPENAKVSQEEVFGPVVCVYAYADLQEAIDRANALDLHFQAAVFTSDVDVALEAGNKLNATAVMINDHTAFRVDWMPFWGRDTSGMGLGGIQYTMHDMTREKLIVFKSAGIP